jgi:hypothetical protein
VATKYWLSNDKFTTYLVTTKIINYFNKKIRRLLPKSQTYGKHHVTLQHLQRSFSKKFICNYYKIRESIQHLQRDIIWDRGSNNLKVTACVHIANYQSIACMSSKEGTTL